MSDFSTIFWREQIRLGQGQHGGWTWCTFGLVILCFIAGYIDKVLLQFDHFSRKFYNWEFLFYSCNVWEKKYLGKILMYYLNIFLTVDVALERTCHALKNIFVNSGRQTFWQNFYKVSIFLLYLSVSWSNSF